METKKGAFIESLKRNNAKIREDRATSIAETTEVKFRRQVEDLEMSLSQLKRDQDNMLDLSPTDAQSLTLASDFDSDMFVKKQVELGLKIRETEIKLDIAKTRYETLFVTTTGAN